MGLSKKDAAALLEAGYISKEQYEKMTQDGVVKESTRSTRPEINVPAEHREVFQDKTYDAMLAIAKELGFEYDKPSEGSGVATLYLKGAGKPRVAKTADVAETAENAVSKEGESTEDSESDLLNE